MVGGPRKNSGEVLGGWGSDIQLDRAMGYVGGLGQSKISPKSVQIGVKMRISPPGGIGWGNGLDR